MKLQHLSKRCITAQKGCDEISCHEICELSKLLLVTCGGSNAPLLRLACQNLKKEKEEKKRRRSSQNDVRKYRY